MKDHARILFVFSHRPRDVISWPRMGYDYDSRKREILQTFRELCPTLSFKAVTVCNVKDAEEVIQRSNEYDGVVVYLLGSTCPAPLLMIERCRKPMLLFDEPYCGSGTFALAYGWSRTKRLPVVGIASSNFRDFIDKAKLFSVIKKLKNTKIILITPKGEKEYVVDERSKLLYGSGRYGGSEKTYDIEAQIERIKELFGVEVIKLSYDDIKRYFEKASEKEAEIIADKWIKNALRVIEPPRNEIVKSAKMYLGLKMMIKDYEAEAITIDCYRRFYEMPAYPCMAFFQLNNEGATAVCEADLSSTITQLILRYLTEELTGEPRPGFVNDPVADFSKNWVIYCHCTAPSKVFGPNGPANPYIIRSHAESGNGVAVQSLMPLNEVVTAVQIHFMREPPLMVIHRGKAVCNVDAEEGCRTKLAVEADAKRIFSNWNKMRGWIAPAHWHRVIVYGDWREQLKDLATLLKIEVFEEDNTCFKQGELL